MEKKITCQVIQDLLPSYIDGLCSEDSEKLVKEHIAACEECRKAYDRMKQEEAAATSTPDTVPSASSPSKTSSSRGAEITIDEQKIMKKVKRKMHHNLWTNAIIGIVAGALLLTLLIFAIRPNRTLSSSDYSVSYYNMSLKDIYYNMQNGGGTEVKTVTYDLVPQDCVFLYDDTSKKLEEGNFVIMKVPGYTNARLAVDVPYLFSDPEISLITYTSDYYISEYDETVIERDGKNYLSVKKVKTPVFGSKSTSGKVTVSTVQFCHIDGIDG